MARVYRIHPAIGAARVGDSRDRYFVGPESPGVAPSLDEPDRPSNPDGTFRDATGRIKRQGARFRIYEYEQDHAGDLVVIREITNAEAAVTWSVHLANRKAFGRAVTHLTTNRNPLITDTAERRRRLIIDAGLQSIPNSNRGPVVLDWGTFQGRESAPVSVPLGELRTDQQGRLIVLGGSGGAASPRNRPLQGTFNNDDWFDDVADGPVTATIWLQGTTCRRSRRRSSGARRNPASWLRRRLDHASADE